LLLRKKPYAVIEKQKFGEEPYDKKSACVLVLAWFNSESSGQRKSDQQKDYLNLQ